MRVYGHFVHPTEIIRNRAWQCMGWGPKSSYHELLRITQYQPSISFIHILNSLFNCRRFCPMWFRF